MKDESGYTLVEILVAVSLALLIAGLAFSSYLFIAKRMHVWRNKLDLENAFHLALRQVAEDLYQGDTLLVRSSADYTIQVVAGDSINYAVRDSVLNRNDRPMHRADVLVSHFDLIPERGNDGHASRIVTTLAMRGARDSLFVTQSVMLRRNASWRPLAPASPLPDRAYP